MQQKVLGVVFEGSVVSLDAVVDTTTERNQKEDSKHYGQDEEYEPLSAIRRPSGMHGTITVKGNIVSHDVTGGRTVVVVVGGVWVAVNYLPVA